MFLKKIALIGSALAVSALPVLASADLVTINHTSKASSVFITDTHVCPTRVTQPGQTLSTPIGIVRALCGNRTSGECTAQVYASSTCAQGGPQTGVVTINLANLNIDAVQSIAPYTITKVGASTVLIEGGSTN
jgi:hypothetical protein